MKKLLIITVAIAFLDLAFIAYSYSTGIQLAVQNTEFPPESSEALRFETTFPDLGQPLARQITNLRPARFDHDGKYTRRTPVRPSFAVAVSRDKFVFPTRTIDIQRDAFTPPTAEAGRITFNTLAAAKTKPTKRSLLNKAGSVLKKPYDWLKVVARLTR